MQLKVSDSRACFGPTMCQTGYRHRRHRGEDNTVLVAREERLTRNNNKTPGLSYLMGDKGCEKPSTSPATGPCTRSFCSITPDFGFVPYGHEYPQFRAFVFGVFFASEHFPPRFSPSLPHTFLRSLLR